MKKREIREYLYNCGLNESDLKPYIKINGTRGKWKFTDTRTFKDNKLFTPLDLLKGKYIFFKHIL